jgi:hypothetical protein
MDTKDANEELAWIVSEMEEPPLRVVQWYPRLGVRTMTTRLIIRVPLRELYLLPSSKRSQANCLRSRYRCASRSRDDRSWRLPKVS